MSSPFRNRAEAGRQLAKKLKAYAQDEQAVVLGLTRGGVVPAVELAKLLNIPMDIIMVRKLRVDADGGQAIGAVTSAGHRILNQAVIEQHHINEAQIEQAEQVARRDLQRLERRYRGASPDKTLADHTVILVDDGMVSGATMQVAIASLGKQRPKRIVVAVPVASQASLDRLQYADEVICLHPQAELLSVAEGYKEFPTVEEDEVADLLAEVRRFHYQGFDIPPFV